MRKVGMGVYCGFIVGIAAVAFPWYSWANLKVTVETNGCLEAGCHAVGSFGANDGTMHGSHGSNPCADCHAEQTTFLDDVFAASCLVCHPDTNSDLCDLSDFMENSLNYNPTGLSCYDCHSDCRPAGTTTTTAAGTTTTTTATGTTTTTTAPVTSSTTTTAQVTIKGKRFDIFLIGPFREGCRATTVTFRSDNVLVLNCLDGFGTYLSVGNIFIAAYWSNDYYLGYGMGMVLSGFAFDSYIFAGGIAYFGNIISTVAMSGYVL